MTLALIRRDPAFRSLAKWLPITVSNTLLLLGVFFLMAVKNQQVDPRGFVWILWTAVALYLALGKPDQRCGDLDMVLPVPARRLWTAHVAALVAGGGLILAVTMGLAVLIAGWVERLERVPAVEIDALAVALHLGAGLLLTVALLQSGRPALRQPADGRRRHLWTVVVLVGVAALMGALVVLPLYLVLVPLAAAAAIAASTYRAVPAAFTLAGTDLADAPGPADAAAVWTSVPRRGTFRSLVRLFFGEPKLLAGLVFIPLLGTVLGGITELRFHEAELRYLYIPLTIYILLTVNGLVLERQLHLIDSLPISRRKLFAFLIAPLLALLVTSYGGVRLAAAALDLGDEVEYVQGRRTEHFFVKVPMRRWQIAWDGAVPQNAAPWGESHDAGSGELFRGGKLVLYSPFSTPEGSSPEFVAWQLSRAAEAVYGQKIAPDELAQRYLTARADGEVVLREGGLSVREDYGLSPLPGGPVFPVILLVVAPPWLLCLGLFLRSFRAGVTKKQRMVFLWCFLGLFLGLMLAEVALALLRLGDPQMIRGFLEILIARGGENPLMTFAAWVTSAAALLLTYLWARGEFQKIEIDDVKHCNPVCY